MGRASNTLAAAALAGLTLFDIAIASAAPKKPEYVRITEVPWSGFYAGGFLGVQSVNIDTTGQSFSTNGFDGGVLAGFNYHLAPSFVVGAEADFGFIRLDNHSTFDNFNVRSDWHGDVTGRFGFLVGQPGWTPSVLLYAKSGLAVMNQQIIFSDGSDSATRTGWAVGAGIETAFIQFAGITPSRGTDFTNGWNLRAEFLHEDYGSHSYFDNQFEVKSTINLFRVGLTHQIVTR